MKQHLTGIHINPVQIRFHQRHGAHIHLFLLCVGWRFGSGLVKNAADKVGDGHQHAAFTLDFSCTVIDGGHHFQTTHIVG